MGSEHIEYSILRDLDNILCVHFKVVKIGCINDSGRRVKSYKHGQQKTGRQTRLFPNSADCKAVINAKPSFNMFKDNRYLDMAGVCHAS